MTNIDKEHIWHPYASVLNPKDTIKIKSANEVYLNLEDGTSLIDGMSSWWSVIHGYNNKKINLAINEQTSKMSHVMFGGLTHDTAIELTQKLLNLLDDSLEKIFYCDSGSVSVEIAMKMALQYHYKKNNNTKTRFLTVRRGYHGDTFGAMSVCDPVTGMHTIFSEFLTKNYFVSEPKSKFDEEFDKSDLDEIKKFLEENHENIAAVIIEPIVQGAGGMRFYSPKYLEGLRELTKKYNVLLIFDEIATGFGRTGKLFAYQHTNIVPDIMTIGKALTAGYMTMAATITTKEVAQGIEKDGNILMHGPTFMGNPLACKVASTSIDLLEENNWQENVLRIEKYLKENLIICENLNLVKEVRVLGAIGVVELHENVDMVKATQEFVKRGVWIRPFMKLIYIMPPFITTNEQLQKLVDAIYATVEKLQD
ncbi:adenosylmethionine--8-amino-7-oxononanoate transaminase [Arcobacter arenosus]|uniref:Adenosylmethionine-8-amino-7-oxononanoate aminotransferase n=1 Tax=Arcobacter arenosus TaxID=2576037 RepID=A0A5R8Y3E4_9BACT|nr:adenosylmethionine--8-amino-7-oxononanoate transaminase [Arcobacter arenosus]TLP40619.1 adenosylmethionine--8-amino-7-oxononanoate transaminase [Arcobacter arenosus]